MILLFLACQQSTSDLCTRASERYGEMVCVLEIPDQPTWEAISVDAKTVDQIRTTKYLVPAQDDAPLPTLFVDAGTFPLHHDFFTKGFPEYYEDLSFDAYVEMVTQPDARVYYSGTLTEYRQSGGGSFFGYIVWDDATDSDKTIRCEEVLKVQTALRQQFPLAPVVFVPGSNNQRDAAKQWDCGVDVRELTGVSYEVYTPGEAYGRVLNLDIDALASATEAASFGYQDILILDQAPFDLERVVSGIITGTRQGVLSHLNVRSAARGTINAFIEEPQTAFAAWEGQVVHLVCDPSGWQIAAASEDAAAAWWEELRPDPLSIPAPDTTTDSLPGLLELPTATPEARASAVAAFGAKGSNLATLYQGISTELQIEGFLVPAAWYQRFMDENTWLVDLGNGEAEHSFAETIQAWHEDPDFLNNAGIRRERLEALVNAMKAAPVPEDLMARLSERIHTVFGDNVMVRFRSSSNAEDAIGFTGAGLYESDSACVADSEDGDTQGPSHCDPNKDNEHTLEDALRTVWASLWGIAAWEERDWYGMDHRQAVMGVLVNTQTEDEQANIVAFSKNPLAQDNRMLVEAQIGDLDVVSAEAGVFPERIFLTLSEGQVSFIDRESHSSETTAWILEDATLNDLGGQLWDISQWFPVDDEIPASETLLWDTEWKVLSDGRLIIKQIRPYLRSEGG